MGMQAGNDKDAVHLGSAQLQASTTQDRMMFAEQCAKLDKVPKAAERATASTGISILIIRSSGGYSFYHI